ncbi:MAG: sialate O-acetylesterase [Planctomycetia bacterium]|nr:sialate O-acetylesterase [Planctomycetia bacterium]
MRLRIPFRSALVVLIVAVAATAVHAAIKLPSIISDNMVLQAGQAAPIWGWDEPGQKVTVRLADKTAEATAGADGRWQVTLDGLKPGTAMEMLIEDAAGDKKAIKNVLVGEVWVCSGQSNMQWPTSAVDQAAEEIAAAKYPEIRFFAVERVTAGEPQTACKGEWIVCSPETVGPRTAVGYLFGRELFKSLNVPVGLIDTCWGGTPSETWTSRKALEAEASLKPLLERWDKAAAEKEDQRNSPNRPANLYNAMIAPLLPYGVRGAIWYQGESNVSRAYQYRTLFPVMIRDWRAAFARPDMPFGFVQIAPFRYGGQDPANCAELWEAQLLTLKNVPNTGMVVTTDIGNIQDIHPKNKQDVCKRLGLWARATVYGQKDLVYSGPIYKSMAVEGNKIRLTFDHVGSGLITRDGKAPTDFTIAGADQKFLPAIAAIDGNTVVVSNDEIKEPAAVRFAWYDTAMPNLCNKESLPASPFRTDQWKGLTEGNN